MDLKQNLRIFLESHQIMSLATYGDHPWIANLYYGVDEDFKFYFVSSPDSLHCRQIDQNKKVACAIYDSEQTPVKKESFAKVGVQLHGEAELLIQKPAIEHGLIVWKKQLGIEENKAISYEAMQNNTIKTKIYKINPKTIQLFTQEPNKEEKIEKLEL